MRIVRIWGEKCQLHVPMSIDIVSHAMSMAFWIRPLSLQPYLRCFYVERSYQLVAFLQLLARGFEECEFSAAIIALTRPLIKTITFCTNHMPDLRSLIVWIYHSLHKLCIYIHTYMYWCNVSFLTSSYQSFNF